MKALGKAGLILGLLLGAASAAQAQVYVGASVSGVLSPGVFGRIDIGNLGGMPPVISPQPVYIERGPSMAPLYIYAAPHERANWRRYCGRYEACGAPVYFVDVGSNGRWSRPVHVSRPAPPPRRVTHDHRHDHRGDRRYDDRRYDDRRQDDRRHDDRRHDNRGPNGRGPDGYGPPGHRQN